MNDFDKITELLRKHGLPVYSLGTIVVEVPGAEEINGTSPIGKLSAGYRRMEGRGYVIGLSCNGNYVVGSASPNPEMFPIEKCTSSDVVKVARSLGVKGYAFCHPRAIVPVDASVMYRSRRHQRPLTESTRNPKFKRGDRVIVLPDAKGKLYRGHWGTTFIEPTIGKTGSVVGYFMDQPHRSPLLLVFMDELSNGWEGRYNSFPEGYGSIARFFGVDEDVLGRRLTHVTEDGLDLFIPDASKMYRGRRHRPVNEALAAVPKIGDTVRVKDDADEIHRRKFGPKWPIKKSYLGQTGKIASALGSCDTTIFGIAAGNQRIFACSEAVEVLSRKGGALNMKAAAPVEASYGVDSKFFQDELDTLKSFLWELKSSQYKVGTKAIHYFGDLHSGKGKPFRDFANFVESRYWDELQGVLYGSSMDVHEAKVETDFRFFDVKKTNESVEDYEKWKKVAIHLRNGESDEVKKEVYRKSEVEDRPVLWNGNGKLMWYEEGKRGFQWSRKGGPAVIAPNGNLYWYTQGLLHRKDGPAVENADGTLIWDRQGNPPTPEEIDDYLRRRIAEDPTFVTTPVFAKNASPELKAESPEAGHDFGFFDAKANETKIEKVSIPKYGEPIPGDPVPKFNIGDRVMKIELGHMDEVGGASVVKALVPIRIFIGNVSYREITWSPDPKSGYKSKCRMWKYSSETDKILGAPRWNKYPDLWVQEGNKHFHGRECDLTTPDEYVRGEIAKDPLFVTTKLFRELASPKLKAEHPEAGTDFGFFDATRKVERFRAFANESIENVSTPRKERNNTIWRLPDGTVHRTDGPAVENTDGSREWYVDGKRHRTDGPAIEEASGTRWWYVDGKCHRTDGPAVEEASGTRQWYVDDKRHRTDGPAIDTAYGYREWHVDGKRMSEKDFGKRFPEGYRKWWESQRNTPRFKEAPKEIRDEHPEAGTDFGFFDAKKETEK